MRRRKYQILAYVIVGIAALVLLEISAVEWYKAVRKPNLILISIDSLRADRMGLYGYSRDTTPNMDAFAKDAVVFDNYFSAAYLTPISEMAVQTGRYPIRNGVINFNASLRGDVETFAEILRRHGYQTASIGSSPEFIIHPGLKEGFSRGFDVFNIWRGEDPQFRTSAAPIDNALWWLQDERKKGVPFYLWIHIGSVHWPYGAEAEPHFTDASYRGYLKDITYDGFPEPYGYMHDGMRYESSSPPTPLGPLADADIQYVNDRYDDGLRETDRNFKTLFDYLDSSGLLENSVVVLQSEHGEGLGERGYIAHYDLFDEQVRVPLIIRLPEKISKRVSELASGIDVLPTVLDALGIEPPEVDGMSFLPFLRGAAAAPRDHVFITRTPLWERVVSYLYPLGGELLEIDDREHYFDTAIRTHEWKLIHRRAREAEAKYSWWNWLTGSRSVHDEYELYALTSDPRESRNVYSQFKDDARIVLLRRKLLSWEDTMERELPHKQPAYKIQEYF